MRAMMDSRYNSRYYLKQKVISEPSTNLLLMEVENMYEIFIMKRPMEN
jgi:hypothetical protein